MIVFIPYFAFLLRFQQKGMIEIMQFFCQNLKTV